MVFAPLTEMSLLAAGSVEALSGEAKPLNQADNFSSV
jgi:hypothetical protein